MKGEDQPTRLEKIKVKNQDPKMNRETVWLKKQTPYFRTIQCFLLGFYKELRQLLVNYAEWYSTYILTDCLVRLDLPKNSKVE
jgi:hypothetical protein